MKVGVVGATGVVGTEVLKTLSQRRFPVSELVAFASPRSEGKEIPFQDQVCRVRKLKPGCFEGLDFVFSDVSDELSQEWLPQAAEAGAWSIDNSAAFRMDEDISIIVPEVNGRLLEAKLKGGRELTARDRIVAGPNCSTAQLVVVLRPLLDDWGLKRVFVATYQSTSGGGAAAVQELKDQTRAVLDGQEFQPSAFPYQIAFNCIPQIGSFQENGSTSEEQKMLEETRKILGVPDLPFSATCVRVPTLSCHSEAVNLQLESSFQLDEVRKCLQKAPGVIVQDDPQKAIYPMGQTSSGSVVESGAGRDAVYVGRLREDVSAENGLNLWLVSDNLRKGAALNAVQIAEVILEYQS